MAHNQAVQTTEQGGRKDIKQYLASADVQRKIGEVLPKFLTAERMTRVMAWTVDRVPGLINCTPTSLLSSLMKCSMAGLEPDGHHAHLIPYGTECQVIFDWKGLVAIERRHGIEMKGTLVRENDDFKFIEDDGTGKTVVQHSFDVRSERGPVIGVYSRAVSESGVDYEYMSIAEVKAVRARSRASSKGPWVTDEEEMIRKTPIRRHCKRLPMTFEEKMAVEQELDSPAVDVMATAKNVTPIPATLAEPKVQALPAVFQGATNVAPKSKPDPQPERAPAPNPTPAARARKMDPPTPPTPPAPDPEKSPESTQEPEDGIPGAEMAGDGTAPASDFSLVAEPQPVVAPDEGNAARTNLAKFVTENNTDFETFVSFAALKFPQIGAKSWSDWDDISEGQALTMISADKFLKQVATYARKAPAK